MLKMTKTEAVKVIYYCAVQYNNNLVGKNILFFTSKDSQSTVFETLFMPYNFLHLTGVKSRLKSEVFYQAAYNNRLSPNDISFAADGTTEHKLNVLSRLMNIHILARMVGDYDNSRPLLIADKFAGTVTTAMGFVNVNGIYIPNTALKMDVRQITANATRHKVAAIFTKPRNDDLYKRITYIAKGVAIDDIALSSALREKVDVANLSNGETASKW